MMNRDFVLKVLIVLCLAGLFCSAVSGSDIQWLSNFGGNSSDDFSSVVNTSDGGFVAVGSSNQGSFGNGDWTGISSKGNSDAIIVKYDVDGNMLWKKNFGGNGADSFKSVVAVSDGGFVAVGSSYYDSFGNGDWVGVGGKGNYDAIIVKFDASGNVLWKKNFGGNQSDIFRSITNAPFGIGFAVAGYSESGSFGNGDWTGIIGKGYADAIIVRYSSNGDIYWKKNFGGSWDDSFNSITNAADGSVVAVGNSSYTSNIVKYNSQGNLIWSKLSNTFSLKSVAASPDGGFVAVGEADLAHDAIVKFDAQGNVTWSKSEEGYVFNAVTVAADGKITAVGYDWERFGSYISTIITYNQQGNKLITRNFDSSSFNAVTNNPDGGLVAVGSLSSLEFGNGDWTGISGKGGTDAIIIKYVFVDSISLSQTSAALYVGNTLQLSAAISPSNAANNELSWSSSDNNIAIVDSNGLVTAISPGNAVIKVCASGGYPTATCSIKAGFPVTGISINPPSATIGIGYTLQLASIFSPAGVLNKNVTWSSSNNNTATVDMTGKVTALAVGNTVITVKTEEGNYIAICSITVVVPVPVAGITIDSQSAVMHVNEAKQLTANISPSNASDMNVIWYSSNPIVAAVDTNGMITALSAGNADITVITEEGNKYATCSIRVIDAVLWKKNFGGSSFDSFYSVTNASDGGFVAVGVSDSFGNGDWIGISGNGGNSDAIIVKYDAQGNLVWKKNFGGSSNESFNSVTASNDGGFVAVGYSRLDSFGNGDWLGVSGNGGIDAILVKYDSQGNLVWKKNFGGASDESFSSVEATIDGGFVVVGKSYTSSGNWHNDGIIVRYDPDGNVIWEMSLSGGGDNFNSVTTTIDGGFAVVGYASAFGNGEWVGYTGKGDYDATIVKYDADGNVIWKNNFGGSGYDEFKSITTASDGGYIVAGYSYPNSFGNGDWAGYIGKGSNDAIIVKYDEQGNILWKKNFGGRGNDGFYSITDIPDGGFAAIGYSALNSFNNGDWLGIIGKGNNDAIMAKYDKDGNELWKLNFGGSDSDFFNSVAIASGDGYVLVGRSDIITFGTSDWIGINGKGNSDATIIKLSPVNVNGTIDLQSFSGDKIGIPGTAEIRANLTGNVIESHPITLDSNGNYSFETVTMGNYTLAAKCSHWLSQSQPALIDFDSSFNFSLLNGDCNGDNGVDEGDFGIISKAWYSSIGEEKFDFRADLNGDGAVEEGDFAILSSAWYQSGE